MSFHYSKEGILTTNEDNVVGVVGSHFNVYGLFIIWTIIGHFPLSDRLLYWRTTPRSNSSYHYQCDVQAKCCRAQRSGPGRWAPVANEYLYLSRALPVAVCVSQLTIYSLPFMNRTWHLDSRYIFYRTVAFVNNCCLNIGMNKSPSWKC